MRTVATDVRWHTHQEDAVLAQANPISGTQYALMNETMVRLYWVLFFVEWTVQPSPLELFHDLDGVTQFITEQGNPVSLTAYYDSLFHGVGTGVANLLVEAIRQGNMDLCAKEVLLQIETTGGTVQTLSGRAMWSRYE